MSWEEVCSSSTSSSACLSPCLLLPPELTPLRRPDVAWREAGGRSGFEMALVKGHAPQGGGRGPPGGGQQDWQRCAAPPPAPATPPRPARRAPPVAATPGAPPCLKEGKEEEESASNSSGTKACRPFPAQA